MWKEIEWLIHASMSLDNSNILCTSTQLLLQSHQNTNTKNETKTSSHMSSMVHRAKNKSEFIHVLSQSEALRTVQTDALSRAYIYCAWRTRPLSKNLRHTRTCGFVFERGLLLLGRRGSGRGFFNANATYQTKTNRSLYPE